MITNPERMLRTNQFVFIQLRKVDIVSILQQFWYILTMRIIVLVLVISVPLLIIVLTSDFTKNTTKEIATSSTMKEPAVFDNPVKTPHFEASIPEHGAIIAAP